MIIFVPNPATGASVQNPSRDRQNPLKSPRAWDLSAWFFAWCLRETRGVSQTYAPRDCVSPVLRSWAASRVLLGTAPVHGRGWDAPWVLEHQHGFKTHEPPESGHPTLRSERCRICGALNSPELCAKDKFERAKSMIQQRSPVQCRGASPRLKLQLSAV